MFWFIPEQKKDTTEWQQTCNYWEAIKQFSTRKTKKGCVKMITKEYCCICEVELTEEDYEDCCKDCEKTLRGKNDNQY